LGGFSLVVGIGGHEREFGIDGGAFAAAEFGFDSESDELVAVGGGPCSDQPVNGG
jgi:hypothetical protein